MSRNNLEKYDAAPRAPSERILMTLKMQGALTSTQLGERLGITSEGARQHLQKLAENGLVSEEQRAKGRGRPATYWHLTEKGQDRFPNSHAALTVDILRSISDVLGQDALERIIGAREAETQAIYRAAMVDCHSLKERVEKLAELRSAEGYMAQSEEREEGGMLFVENHCPICAAATFCQGFCRAEKMVFENVLGGDVSVERVEHIVSGARRCAYVITEDPGSAKP
ncbi:MAG: metalloregulator ArsR/SmtB family transcription factor [Hoeflea sp. D1-CHI-28]